MSKVPCTPKIAEQLVELFGSQVIPGLTVQAIADDLVHARLKVSMKGPDGKLLSPKARELIAAESVVKQTMVKASRAKYIAAQDLQIVNGVIRGILDNFKGNERMGMEAFMVGVMNSSEGSRSSIALSQKVYFKQFQGQLIGELEDSKLMARYMNMDDDFQRDVFLAAGSLGDDLALKGFDPDAVKMARLLNKQSISRLELLHMMGVDVEELKNRIARQTHDTYKVRRASRSTPGARIKSRGDTTSDMRAWTDYVMVRLDHEKTFPAGIEDKEAWLDEIYRNIASGYLGAYTLGDPLSNTRSGFNLAKSLEEERVLHFTPEGQYEYMKEFGAGSLRNMIASELDLMAHRIGLMDELGVNALPNLQEIVRGVRKGLEPGSKEFRRFERYTSGFDAGKMDSPMGRQWFVVSGEVNRVVSDVGALWGTAIRAFEHMTSLGFATLSSVVDVANISSELHIQKGGFFSPFIEAIEAPLRGFKDGADRQFAQYMGIGVETMLGINFERYSALNSPSGNISRAMNQYFRINLLEQWTSSSRRGAYVASAAHMGDLLRGRAKMADTMRATLRQYGIGDQEMSFLRNAAVFEDIGEGRVVFNARRIGSLPEEMFSVDEASIRSGAKNIKNDDIREAFIKRMVKESRIKQRMDLQKKFEGFLIDRNDLAVLTPGAETKAMVARGHGRGSIDRELLEMFWQFKQFPYAMIKLLMKRNMFALGDGGMPTRPELNIFAQHLVMLTGLGATAMYLKDIAKNRKPFVPTEKEQLPKYFLAAFLTSGAGGLYADFMLGQWEDFDHKLLRMAGPAANELADALSLGSAGIQKFMSDDYKEGMVKSEMWDMIDKKLPFSDIFYSKTMLNFGMLYWVRETLDEGSLAREAAWSKRNGGGGHLIDPYKWALGV